MPRAVAPLLVLAASGVVASCGTRARSTVGGGRTGPSVERIAADLDRLSRGWTGEHRSTFAGVLQRTLDQDAYRCAPPVRDVLAAPRPGHRTRRIEGRMPHYGFYHGRMLYRIGPRRWVDEPGGGGAGDAADDGSRAEPSLVWLVALNVAVDASPAPDSLMELPDCELRPALRGPVRCEGTPYPDAPGVEACPDVGRFEALATRDNLRALLRRWSREAEAYYNRDARHFGLPVRYDFEFFLADDAAAARAPVDLRLPLSLSCGRTPYFAALRTGWSLPIVAHEMAHFLGLLDEYEMLSGITPLYPKTPFDGAERSRMGLSMKRDTRLLPLHHYLVLRRYHCPEPASRDPFVDVLRP